MTRRLSILMSLLIIGCSSSEESGSDEPGTQGETDTETDTGSGTDSATDTAEDSEIDTESDTSPITDSETTPEPTTLTGFVTHISGGGKLESMNYYARVTVGITTIVSGKSENYTASVGLAGLINR